MTTIRSITAFYPEFLIGGEPRSVQCEIREIEANGKRYTKTPFAMLDSFGADDLERQIGRGFYATQAECDEYLAREYPNWKTAAPIMDALEREIRFRGKLVGESVIERITGLNSLTNELYRAARGNRGITLKTIRAALKKLGK